MFIVYCYNALKVALFVKDTFIEQLCYFWCSAIKTKILYNLKSEKRIRHIHKCNTCKIIYKISITKYITTSITKLQNFYLVRL